MSIFQYQFDHWNVRSLETSRILIDGIVNGILTFAMFIRVPLLYYEELNTYHRILVVMDTGINNDMFCSKMVISGISGIKIWSDSCHLLIHDYVYRPKLVQLMSLQFSLYK